MVAYSFNKRFVQPIRVGLSKISLSFDCAPKRQTIRAVGKRRHARPGEMLQLYTGMRTKQCAKIGDARCIAVREIAIDMLADVVRIGPFEFTGPSNLNPLARDDGFHDWEDMMDFWRQEHGDLDLPWIGVLIQWEPL